MGKLTIDTTIAKKLGLIPAVVFEVVKNDIEDNYRDNKNILNGEAWTKATSHYLTEVIPYISRTTIISALDRLVYKKYLVVGQPFDNKAKGGNPAKWFKLGESYEP